MHQPGLMKGPQCHFHLIYSFVYLLHSFMYYLTIRFWPVYSNKHAKKKTPLCKTLPKHRSSIKSRLSKIRLSQNSHTKQKQQTTAKATSNSELSKRPVTEEKWIQNFFQQINEAAPGGNNFFAVLFVVCPLLLAPNLSVFESFLYIPKYLPGPSVQLTTTSD